MPEKSQTLSTGEPSDHFHVSKRWWIIEQFDPVAAMARGLLWSAVTARPPQRNDHPMMKHSIALLVASATMALAGCDLYFGGDQHDNDSWTYCGSDGYYECTGDTCYWRGPDCPAGTGSGSGSANPGSECKTS